MNKKRPDAVRAPIRHAGPGDSFARLTRLQAEFTSVLEQPRLFVRLQGAEHFLTGRPEDTLFHAGDADRPGEPCYDWVDRGDGVLYGYRRFDEQSP